MYVVLLIKALMYFSWVVAAIGLLGFIDTEMPWDAARNLQFAMIAGILSGVFWGAVLFIMDRLQAISDSLDELVKQQRSK